MKKLSYLVKMLLITFVWNIFTPYPKASFVHIFFMLYNISRVSFLSRQPFKEKRKKISNSISRKMENSLDIMFKFMFKPELY